MHSFDVDNNIIHSLQASDDLHVLQKPDDAASPDLHHQLILGYAYDDKLIPAAKARWRNVRDSRMHAEIQLSHETLRLSPDEMEQFRQEFKLCTTGGILTSDFALLDKVFLSQGHIVIPITFLQSMEVSSLPDDALEVTFHTLQLIPKTSPLTFRATLLKVFW